jgi:hypothetical protein
VLTTGWARSSGSPNESTNLPIISVAHHGSAADYKRLLTCKQRSSRVAAALSKGCEFARLFGDPDERCYLIVNSTRKVVRKIGGEAAAHWSGRGDLNARPPAPKAFSGSVWKRLFSMPSKFWLFPIAIDRRKPHLVCREVFAFTWAGELNIGDAAGFHFHREHRNRIARRLAARCRL